VLTQPLRGVFFVKLIYRGQLEVAHSATYWPNGPYVSSYKKPT